MIGIIYLLGDIEINFVQMRAFYPHDTIDLKMMQVLSMLNLSLMVNLILL